MLYVSPRDTLTNGNDTPAANCHLTGCLLSHNGRLLSSPSTAGLAQSQEKHTRVLEVSDSIFCQQSWTGWVKKFHMWLSISVTRLAATSTSLLPLLENNRQLEWKMCIFLCSAVSQCCDSQAWLRSVCCCGCDYVGPKPSHPSVYFLFMLWCLYFWRYWKMSACCAKKPAVESFCSIDSALKCFRWLFHIRHAFTSLQLLQRKQLLH